MVPQERVLVFAVRGAAFEEAKGQRDVKEQQDDKPGGILNPSPFPVLNHSRR